MRRSGATTTAARSSCVVSLSLNGRRPRIMDVQNGRVIAGLVSCLHRISSTTKEDSVENRVPTDDEFADNIRGAMGAGTAGGDEPAKLTGLFEALENFGMSSERVQRLRASIEDLGVREGVQKAAEYFAEQLEQARDYARNNKEKVIGGAAGVLVGASLLAMAVRRASGDRGAAGDTKAAARGGRNSRGGGRKASSSSSSSSSSRTSRGSGGKKAGASGSKSGRASSSARSSSGGSSSSKKSSSRSRKSRGGSSSSSGSSSNSAGSRSSSSGSKKSGGKSSRRSR